MLFPRQMRALRNSRGLIIAFASAVTLIYLFHNGHLSSPLPPNEFESLQQAMNDGGGGGSATTASSEPQSKPSFDWSTVSFKYPDVNMSMLPTGQPLRLPRIQHRFLPETPKHRKTREQRRYEVRAAFQRCWASYRKYAWGRDALRPVSAGYQDQLLGWSATLVDALDTLWIMGLRQEFDEAVDAVAKLDFGTSNVQRVSMFEITIRHLGGLLAAYDLSGRPVLLRKAVELGDLLYAGFNTPNRMPVDFIDFEAAKTGVGLDLEWTVASASPGTLVMEMTRLSQVTGDPKYYSAARKVMDVFERGQNATRLPGMWPQFVSMANQDVTSRPVFTLGGAADSLYEYLPKMHALLGGLEPRYRNMSRSFMDAAARHLFYRPMLPGGEDVLISGVVNVADDGVPNLNTESEHLTHFVGGLFALAGRLFGNRTYVDIGTRLARGSIYTYRAMPTGVGPERFDMVPCPVVRYGLCVWNEKVFADERAKQLESKSHLPEGFTTAKDPRYMLRPEAAETAFVLYRITGKQEFQDAAWDMFEAVDGATKTKYANAAVMDVTTAEGLHKKDDFMESFWLAETLKYFYLALSPPSLISLDEYVLSTEAHPFKRPTGSKPMSPSAAGQ